MTIQTSDNKFGVAQWIVDPVSGLGTHTTIAAALAAASSGENIFIRPGVYTEDITLKAGVNLTGFTSDSPDLTVNITGKISASYTGSVTLANLTLRTNSDFFLEITGSGALFLDVVNCNLIAADNTGISFTNSNASSIVELYQCFGDVATTGVALFAHSSAGTMQFEWCDIGNSGSSTTASTASAGSLFLNWSQFIFPITTSGTVSFGSNYCSHFTSPINTTSLTLGSSGPQQVTHGNIASGTASDISIGSTAAVINTSLAGSNANQITGAGTCNYTGVYKFGAGAPTINTSSTTTYSTYMGPISFDDGANFLSAYASSTWTPGLEFGGGSTGITYTTQAGNYVRVGNLVHAQCNILLSSKGTDTGAATITGLPFTSSGVSVGTATWGSIDLDVAGGYYYLSANLASASTTLTLQENGDNVAIAALTDADFGNSSSITISIQYMVA